MPGRFLLVMPVALIGGWLCAALALEYVRRISLGAEPDADTLRSAMRAACSGPGLKRVSLRWAAMCAGMLAVAFLPLVVQPSPLAIARAAACAVLLVLAIIDVRTRLLPDALTLPLLWAGLMLAWAGVGVRLDDAVVAAAAAWLLLRALDFGFEVWRGMPGMGGGDMKLAAALGAWLGWAPLPALLLAASVAGIVFAMAGGGRRAWRAPLAFGPFLAMAGAVGLAGDPVVQLLFQLGNGLCTRSA